MKPNVLTVEFNNIPNELKRINRWVLWKFVEVGDEGAKRWAKLPMQTNSRPASSSNPQTWTDFFTVQDTYLKGGFDGVGIVFDGSDLMGIDIDDCYDGSQLSEFAQNILRDVKGYAEYSPSGTGIKIFTKAEISQAYVDHSKGLEIYNRGRYFTVTGHAIPDRSIPDSPQDLSQYVEKRAVSVKGEAESNPVDEYDLSRVEVEVLKHFNPDCGYAEWLEVGMAMHHQFQGSYDALEAWDRWSSTAPSYVSGLCERKWGSFSTSKASVTLRSLLFRIRQIEKKEAIERGEVIIENNNPLFQAKAFLDYNYASEDGYTVTIYGGDIYRYNGKFWEVIEDDTLEAQMYLFFAKCFYETSKGLRICIPNSNMLSNVQRSIKAYIHLPRNEDFNPPIWFAKYRYSMPDAHSIISLQNGLYDIKNEVMLPHHVGLFATHALPFEYNPNAACPNWIEFMGQIFEGDQESSDLIQEMFGYVLTGDMKQQKFFNIVGPRRSGKGTINKVLTSLLGQHNTISPQMEELIDTFGLQPWIHKSLATFTDARLPDRNRSGIVSQLLRIVGADPVTVNRKNKEAWSGHLNARIVVYSNEALQLSEASNALTGRMLVVQMTKSFYGKEDVGLIDRLLPELSGIFNWAMEGNKRRLSRVSERFIQPQSGESLLKSIEDIGNPMIEFMETYFQYDLNERCDKHDAFKLWRRYCTDIGLPSGSLAAFTRKMLATNQDYHTRVIQTWKTGGGKGYAFTGFGVNQDGHKYLTDLGFGSL